MGHHWLGRAAFGLSIAAIFTGIYIAAVGWGYYVAYGATLAMFLLLMAMKDVIDIFMVGYVMTGILYGCSSAAYLHILAMGCYCKMSGLGGTTGCKVCQGCMFAWKA